MRSAFVQVISWR